MVKRAFGLILAGIMVLSVLGLTGCSNGKTFDVDGWTLFRYNGNNNTERGQVNIVSANNESLVVDGVLTIPAKIGKYDIHGFGYPDTFYGGKGAWFTINENCTVERIVLAAELYVDELFWGRDFASSLAKNVEFLSSDFNRIEGVFRYETVGLTYIIPDGSMQNFIEKFGDFNIDDFSVIEKSNYLEDENNV